MEADYIIERFHRDRQILANLSRPNIARLFDGGTTDETLLRRLIHYDLSPYAGMQSAMIGDYRTRLAGGHRKSGTRIHNPRVKAAVVGDDVVENLIAIVNSDDLARLGVNR